MNRIDKFAGMNVRWICKRGLIKDDQHRERRARYRLKRHGLTLHKLRNGRGYAVINEYDDDDRGFFENLMKLQEFIETLVEKEALAG